MCEASASEAGALSDQSPFQAGTLVHLPGLAPESKTAQRLCFTFATLVPAHSRRITVIGNSTNTPVYKQLQRTKRRHPKTGKLLHALIRSLLTLSCSEFVRMRNHFKCVPGCCERGSAQPTCASAARNIISSEIRAWRQGLKPGAPPKHRTGASASSRQHRGGDKSSYAMRFASSGVQVRHPHITSVAEYVRFLFCMVSDTQRVTRQHATVNRPIETLLQFSGSQAGMFHAIPKRQVYRGCRS
jgi:hypothetical protein